MAQEWHINAVSLVTFYVLQVIFPIQLIRLNSVDLPLNKELHYVTF